MASCEARENPVQNWLKQSEGRYLWRGERTIYEGLEGVKHIEIADFQMPIFDCLPLHNRLRWALLLQAPLRSDKSLTPFSIASYIADKSKSLLEIRFKSRFDVLRSQD